MKKLLLCMLLALGVVLLHAQAQAAEKKSPEAQLTAAQAVPAADVASDTTVAKPAIKVFRDYDWSKGGYGNDVNIQKAAYTAAKAKYQQTWTLADAKACSDVAFRTDVAAWPFVNLAFHLIQTDGDCDAIDAALAAAEQVLGDFQGGDSLEIQQHVDKDKNWIADHCK